MKSGVTVDVYKKGILEAIKEYKTSLSTLSLSMQKLIDYIKEQISKDFTGIIQARNKNDHGSAENFYGKGAIPESVELAIALNRALERFCERNGNSLIWLAIGYSFDNLNNRLKNIFKNNFKEKSLESNRKELLKEIKLFEEENSSLSERRKKDCEDIEQIIANNDNLSALKKALYNRLKTLDTGWWIFVTGNSRLRNKIYQTAPDLMLVKRDKKPTVSNIEGTAQVLFDEFIAAITYGHSIKDLPFDPILNDLSDSQGYTLLHYCAVWNRKQAAKFLIEQKADVNILNNSGETPLHVAIRLDHYHVVKVLLQNDANWSIPNKDDNTPLMLLRQKYNEGKTDMFDTLLIDTSKTQSHFFGVSNKALKEEEKQRIELNTKNTLQ